MADRVIVIGGGIIGLSSAWQLKKQGWTVTLVTNRATGYGASRVNAGWFIPGHVDPVPSPGLVSTSMKWMRSSSSPLYIQPRPSLELTRWLATFWRHCNETDYWQGVEALRQLGSDTWDRLDEMHADGMTFEEHRDGLVYVFQNLADLHHELELFERFASPGFAVQGPIVGDDLRELEPALSSKIQGGIWLTQDRSVRPDTVTAALTEWITNNGVDVRTGVKVEGLTLANDRVTDVVFDKGRLETDAVLIAAGAWSPQIAKFAKRRVPIQGGKGYSLDYAPAPIELRHPIEVFDHRHAITPLDGMIRVAGTMEFSGINEVIRPERVEAIVRGAANTLRDWPTDLSTPMISSGLRPMSADGLPIIGWLPGYKNLAIATGHGMLGLTLGPSTGAAIAGLMTNNSSREVLKPFDPARF